MERVGVRLLPPLVEHDLTPATAGGLPTRPQPGRAGGALVHQDISLDGEAEGAVSVLPEVLSLADVVRAGFNMMMMMVFVAVVCLNQKHNDVK